MLENPFHRIGLNPAAEVVVRNKFSRRNLLRLTANWQVWLIGMEACPTAHFLGWILCQQGHDVRLIPAQYVKPYVKTNKNDYIDAEAIAEAVGRPRMRFVPIKSDDQLNLQSVHRVRERWVTRRTGVINQIRGLLLERGVTVRKGAALRRSCATRNTQSCRSQLVRSTAAASDAAEAGARRAPQTCQPSGCDP